MDAQITREAAGEVTRVRPITIAIVALGGEGGGVLADWIVDLAEHGGYLAQATSVPGVAQRTGATIYYVELFAKAAARAAGGQSDGAPGRRPQYGEAYYAAFIRDPDGNRIEAVTFRKTQEQE